MKGFELAKMGVLVSGACGSIISTLLSSESVRRSIDDHDREKAGGRTSASVPPSR